MLKPERVTFSVDDEQFQQFTTSDQLETFLNDSLVHYSTDFKKTDQQELKSIQHSNSLDELSSITMSNQDQLTEHEPSSASAPPSLIPEQAPILNENNLHQFDALTLQQLAVGSNINDESTKTSPSHSTSLADIQKEIDRVKQMKYNRTYSSPTSSLYRPRFTANPFNGPNNNVDLSALTHSVHFNEHDNQANRLPFTSTFITSIPESIVPASGSPSTTNDNHFIPIHHIESPSLEDREVFETFHTKQTSIPGVAIRQSMDLINHNISTPEKDLLTSLHRSASKQALDSQSDHGTAYSGASDDMIFVEWDKERSLFQDYINSLRTEIRVLLQERSEYQKQVETINNNLTEHKHLNLTQINTDQTKFDLLQKSLEEKNLVLEQLQREYESMKEKNTNLTRKVSNLRCDAKVQTGVIDELKQKIAELTVDIQNHVLVKGRLEISMMNLEGDCKIIDAERLRLNNEIKDTLSSKQELEKLLQQANVQIAEQGTTIEMLRSDNIQIRSQLSTTQRRMLQEKQQVMDYLRRIENDLVEKEQIKQRETILRKDYEKLQLIHQKDRQEIDQFNLQINQDKQKLNQLEQERLQLFKTIQNFDDKQTQLESDLDSYKSATKRLYTHFKVPFDSIQSIDQLIPMLEDRYRTEQIAHARVHQIPLVQSTPQVNNEQQTEEIRRLQEDLASTNMQLKQLDEANRAWQEYQQNQLVLLRDRLKLTDMENLSFEDIVQQIENRLNDQAMELQDVKKTNGLQQHANEYQDIVTQLNTNNVRQSKDTQTEDNEEHRPQEISIQQVPLNNNQYEEELRQLREDLATLTAQCAQLNEANRAWQLYHQTELDKFRDKLQNSLPIENNLSLDDTAEHISAHLDQLQNQRESLVQQLQTSEKLIKDIRSELVKDDPIVQQAHLNTINELNQALRLLKQQNDQLETEKYILNQQLEKQSSINFNQERSTPTPDSTAFDGKLVKKQIHSAQIAEAQIHNLPLVQSASPLSNEHEQELQQLRENITLLTNQCAQLDQANQAWQLYQQSQMDNFRKTIQDHLPIDDNATLEQAAQQIAEQITKERNDFTQQYIALEQINDELRSESVNNMETIDELNQELLAIKEKHEPTNDTTSSPLQREAFDDPEEIRQLRENLVSLTAQLDESNRASKQYEEAQVNILRNQLGNCLSIDYNGSFDEIAQQIADQVTREREDFSEKYQALERANNDLRSDDNLESIRQTYMNTVNELNQELLAMKEACDQLDTEKQYLISELEKRPVGVDQDQVTRTTGKTSPSILQNLFEKVPIHSSGANVDQQTEELRQLRENVVALTAQCAQLDEANRAWQSYQQAQADNFRTKLHDYLPIDDNASFDEIAQQIADQVTREREDFSEKYQALERAYNDFQSRDNIESVQQSYMNTVYDLNQKLLAMKEAYDQLDTEKQVLITELEKRPVEVAPIQVTRTTEKLPSDIWKEPFREVPIHASSADAQQQAQELQQLRENVVALTAQCTQLDEANRAWQLYQQTQLDNFRTKLHDYVPVDETASLDDIAQQIVDQATRERENFNERYQALERANNDLQSRANTESIQQSYMNTVNELNQELLAMKEAYNELDTEKQVLANELEKQSAEMRAAQARQTFASEKVSSDLFKIPFAEVPIHTSGGNAEQDGEELRQLRENVVALTTQCAQLNEANHAWQLYQQAQVDNFRNTLHDYLPIDENASFDEFAQQLVDQIVKEREDFNDKFQVIEKANDELRSESTNNLETIKQSYMNTVNELTQELLAMKEAFNELDAEKQVLANELEKQSAELRAEQARQTFALGKMSSDLFKVPFSEVPIHTSSADGELRAQEVQQLRENVVALTAQCAQLDEANRAWQSYQQAQADNFRTTLHDYLPIDDNASFDEIAQQIADQVTREREEFNERYQALERAHSDLQLRDNTESIQQSYINTVNELNQELLAMKEAFNELNAEKQVLANELEKQSAELRAAQARQTFAPGKVSSDLFKLPFAEVPIHTDSAEAEQQAQELQQLRENVVALTAQCAQLNEANRAWQLYQQAQVDNFRNTLHDYLPIDENASFDEFAQQLVDQIVKEREDFNDKFQVIEKANDELRSESTNNLETIKQSYMNTVNELTQELLAMKEAFNELDAEKQVLANELEKQSAELRAEQARQTFALGKMSSDLFKVPFSEVPIHTSSADGELRAQEVQQLRENVVALTAQCAQLDEANRAWQSYQQAQADNFRTTLHDYLPIDDNASFDEIAQQIADQVTREREEFNERYQALERAHSDLQLRDNTESIQQSYMNTVNELNQELLAMKEAFNELNAEKQVLANELEKQSAELRAAQARQTFAPGKVSSDLFKLPFAEVPIHTGSAEAEQQAQELQQLRENVVALTAQCAQLNEANRAWQLYQQAQVDNFRNTLHDYLPIDENASFDEFAQQLVDQIVKEREDFNDKFQAIEKANDELRSESTNNLETIKQSYMNTVNELNQEVLALKEAYDQLDTEKQGLISELEKRPVEVDQDRITRAAEKVPSNIWKEPFREVPIHTSANDDVERQAEEVKQLRESVAALTAQCAQLDEANHAWRLYQQTQADNFRTKLHDYLPIDENASFDDIAQQIVDQMTKEREDFTERYKEVEKVNDDLRSESATNLETIKESYTNAVNELNEELLAMKEAYDQLDAEKQVLMDELEKRPINSEFSPINLSDEVPLQTSSTNVEPENEELQQLRENFAVLTSQYAQLNDANRAWQGFHQSQLDNFRTKVQDCIQLDEDISFDEIAQQIVDQITKEREDFAEQYEALEKTNNDLQSESIEENKNFLILKEQYDEVLREKEMLINQIENREQDKQTIESTNSARLEKETEMSQLRENLNILTAQLKETNRSWEQFEHTQVDLLKTVLPSSTKTSLKEIIPEIILHINHLTEQIDSLKENQRNFQDQYEQKSVLSSLDDRDLALLQSQYTQLDNANRAWQTFYDNQIDLLKTKFQEYIQFDDNLNFEQIIELIVTELDSNENDQLKQQLNDLQETNNLLMNNNQNLTYRLNQFERPSSPFVSQENFKQIHRTPIQEVQIHRSTPVQSAFSQSISEEEVQQLRTELSALTAQCAQLDEANRAWQQYHQNQLELFRKNLEDWIFLDENSTLEQIGQQIINQLDQLGRLKQNDQQSDSNSTDESLNKQYLEQLEELQQQNNLLQLENQQLQVKLNETEQRPSQSAFQRIESSREKVAIHNIDREDEFRQLQNDLAAASAHCLQLEEANRAWQKYQYDQIETFRQNLQQQIPSLNQIENPSLDSISQQIIDYLDQSNSQRDNLIQENDSLRDEIRVQKKESVERPSSADGGRRMFRGLSQDKQIREAQIHNLPLVQSASPLSNEHEQELQQLRENITLLTNQCAQLDQANQAWQLYQQSQMDNFRKTIQDHLPIDDNASLEQAAQQIAEQITKERNNFTQQYIALEQINDELRSESVNHMETIDELNQELLAIKEKHEPTNDTISSPLQREAFDDPEEIRQLRENLVSLTAQLDESNRTWKQYEEAQVDILRNQLENCLSIDYNGSFDEIAQQIADQVTREREDFSEKYQALERANNDLRSGDNLESIRQSYMNTVNELNQELLAMKEAYDQLDTEKQGLISELEKRPVEVDQDRITRTAEKVPSNIWKEPFREVPIHTSGDDNIEQQAEEVQQLRENIAALSAQCAQLDEANHAWRLYQQTQLDNFKTKLHDYLPLDENASFDDIAQHVVDQMTKEHEDFIGRYRELEKVNNDLRSETASHMQSTEQPSIDTIDELTEELLNLRNQYEELEKINQQLLLEKEDLNNQLSDRSIVVGHHSAFESNLDQNGTPIEWKQESELQSSSIPTETEEIRQIRSDLALITSQFTELTQTNENELNSFRHKLQNWISLSPNSTLDEIAQQLNNEFEQQQQIPPETAEIDTQTIEPSEKVHIAIETTPLAYENHHTQIDPIDMIDQQIQTESLLHIWSISNDENLFNSDDDDDRLRDYIEEITSLSPLDLSSRLNRECEQILSKQNFVKTSHPNLELNHLALITIYSLYHQHLTDDAKQLYNDTVIRALKQEYELINNEKNDYLEKYLHEVDTKEKQLDKLQNEYDDLLEQNELERLDFKQSFADLTEKYELKLYNLNQENEKLKYNFNNLEDNYRQNKDENYQQLQNEYQQLREDYNELINQNELLKDYNSQMYQTKLQDNDPNLHDIEIQCNLPEDNQASSWNNDWDEENTNQDLPIQEQGSEKSSNEDEINRLKAMIEEIQLENQYLKELNSQNINTDHALASAIHQSVYADNYVQTESENEQTSSKKDSLPETESNIKQTIDNETQTEEQSQDKLVQVNSKLKRALQTIKDKIHQAVIERSELFPDVGDDTIERLDHLILAIGNQATHIEILNNEYENLLERNQQLEKDIQSNNERISTQTDFNQEEKTTKINDDEEPTLANRLLNFVSNVTSTSRTNEMIDNETQTEEQSQDKILQVNNKLKRVLQNIKDKIHQAVIERPELFPDVADDTIERLDHLISMIGNQATQIHHLQNEYDQAQDEIEQLQSSLEAAQYQIDNEGTIRTEQLVSAAPLSDEISSQSTIEDYEKQIKQLQQKLSQNEDERSLLRERLNEVELEFRQTFDDRASTTAMYEEQLQSLVQERNALVEQQAIQSAESQHEIEQLQEELAHLKQTPVTSNDDVQSLQEVIQQQAEEMKDLSEKYFDLVSRFDAQDELDQQKKDTEERLKNYENQIEHLIREHGNLLDQVQKKSLSSIQTIDNESQTDDPQHDKLAQMNAKLKRVLQGYKEKLHRIATERPDLFVNIRDETSERLDHLISTVEYQAAQIGILQAERDQSEEQLRNEIQDLQSSLEACQYQLANEHPIRTEQLVSAAPSSDEISSQSTIEDYEKQIKQLQQKLSQNEDERSLLRERLNEVELEFRKTFDDHTSTTAMYEEQLQSLVQERNALVEQQAIQSAESQNEIEQLQQQLDELKQLSTTAPVDLSSNEEIQSLKDEIEEKSVELQDLSEKYFALSSQLNSYVNLQTEFDRLKMEAEKRLTDYENQIENLTRERAALLEEIQKNASLSVQTTDNERQIIDDQQQDKLAKMNTKLKRALQTLKEKINRIVTERPDLFANIGEETNERLDHLISTVEHQATHINALQAEHSEVEEQLRNEIRELQSSAEAYRYQIENERPIRTEQLVTAAPPSDDISRSTIEDYEKQIKQLQQKLSQNEDERSLLRERLNEVELEFRKTFDDRASTTAMYEEQLQSLVQERNALVEQQAIQLTESQNEIEQLQEELTQLKQSDEDINSLNEIIEQQSEQLKHLNEKYIAVSSQLRSQAELDRQKEEAEERLTDYENQIENLTRERAALLEEIQKNASSSVQTTDNERQTTGDQQQDKLAKMNAKLKRAFQTFKEKINRIATERPDLFANIGEETNERLDHLISTVEHQATQINALQAEHSEVEEQLRNEINELQNSFDLYRQEIDNENRLKSLSFPPTLIQQTEAEPTEQENEIQPLQTSNDNQWNDWSMDPPQQTDTKLQRSTDEEETPSVASRLFGLFKNVTSPWAEEPPTNDWDDQNSLLRLSSEEPQQTISSPSSIDNLLQLIRNKIQQIISEYPNLFPNSSEDVLDNLDQFVSIIKNQQNQIEELQNKSIADEHQKHIESSTPSDQRISRRVFEREMLAWSKESERLKQFVKQIQIENKKLKDIIFKFEPIIRDYMHENERLKQENQQLSLLSYSSNTEDSISSDRDICYLTLKWLTYEVAQRTSNTNEQSSLISDDHDIYLRQRLIDTEQQLKSIRIQNQKLKKQLETYTIQFKHIQHEIKTKNEEISTLKNEIEKLRASETQYRLEVDRLKVDLQCDQVKFQQLERQLTDLKFEQTSIDDTNSTNNLHELLELKERELNALKEKLDYTIQAHQLELQEAIKANQFSLDNVQRFEQLDQRNQEKRKELEKRLGKICKIVRPLIDNQYLFREESMIDIDELQQLVTDTEAEEKVINSLGPIRDCLGLLESQMKELHDNLLENHARRSKKSKYKPGENQWELTSQSDVSENSDLFPNSSSTDSIENDVRLCLDDILYDIIVRTIVK